MANDLSPMLRDVWNFMLDVVFLVDQCGNVVNVNNACEAILGYRPEEMIGRPLADFQAPEDRGRTQEEALRVLGGETRIGFENRYVHRDGRIVHLMWSARSLPGRALRVGVARDIGQHTLIDLRNAANHAILAAANEAANMQDLCQRIHGIVAGLLPVAMLAVVTEDGSAGTEVIYEAGELTPDICPRQWYARLDCAAEHLPALAFRFPIQNRIRGALFVRAPDGATYCSESQELLRFVTNVTALALERKQLYAELLRAAEYDELTGLLNRRAFHERLANALARCRRSGHRAGLLFIDVDDFKEVNDTYGHATGDAVLREVARRVSRCARGSDAIGRLGGDEFVVLAEDLAAPGDAQLIADKIVKAVSLPMTVGVNTLRVSLSIGTAVYPHDSDDERNLLKVADGAMYAAKQARKNSRR